MDILVVSVDATSGWRASARELERSLARAGARVESAAPGPVPRVRTFALTDFVQARAARRACQRGVAEHDPAAVIYCSITAALLWPRPGAVWVDTLAAENRPGRHGGWQRIVERRRLAEAPLVLAMSAGTLAPLRHLEHRVVLPCPVESSGDAEGVRDITAITYAADPEKRRLAHVLSAWAEVRRSDEILVVAGVDRLPPSGAEHPIEGVQLVGRLEPSAYRALLRRARVFVAAPTREDYGIAPLEALADGCMLVSEPATGPYPALHLARALDSRLVADDLVRSIRTALDDPSPRYAERARELLAPFSRQAVDETVSRDVLPRLLPGFE